MSTGVSWMGGWDGMDGWMDGWVGGWVEGNVNGGRVWLLSLQFRARFSRPSYLCIRWRCGVDLPGEGADRAEAKGCGGRGRRRFRLGRLAPAASTKAEGEVDAFLEAGHVRVLWVCVGLVCLPSLQRGLAPALEQASG